MPVFHPEFPAFCEDYGKALAETANEPTLLGIMTENEIQCPVDLLDRYLASDVNDPDVKHGHDAAVAWLTARKGSVDTFSSTRTIHRNRKTSTTWAARTKACLTSTGSRMRRCSNAPAP